MAVSKAQQRAVHKYVKDNYDRIELTVPKGRKAELKALADSRGQSVNAFVNEAIDAAVSGVAVQAGGAHGQSAHRGQQRRRERRGNGGGVHRARHRDAGRPGQTGAGLAP